MWKFLFLHETTGVAMVPYPNSPKSPYFHDCLNWLLDNQLDDGKDQINKGLHYIESNFALVTKKNEASPSGFDIIFPDVIQMRGKHTWRISQNDLEICMTGPW
ncbi:unnamed protein product [Lactuca virosa]|uniref:Uncharacterized protein n=1 Tax=Lactuca virosa TaxID=75947 RepID=A0AAU9NQS3_9ASTR|nr:unnamed protein product [Lactuca virosa]